VDIHCVICGEPWDLFELEDVEGVPVQEARHRFAKDGCVVFGNKHTDPPDTERAQKSRALFDHLGDDIDGIAALSEDLL
jgi:hypothetical protein